MKTLLRNHLVARVAALITALGTSACLGTDTVSPPQPVAGSLSVDASAGWVYVSLANRGTVVPAPSAAQSSQWDIAFNATSVMLNSGAAGPAGVTGFCVCQNAAASREQILAMTADSELAGFTAVTTVPANAQFTAESLSPAIAGWYTGSGTASAADPGKVWVVRLADGASFAKVRVTALQSPTATTPGQVTLEYAVQPAGSASFGATQSSTVNTTTGEQSLDLNTGALTSDAGAWDLRFSGYTILVNGGVSGSGMAAATPASFSVTSANAFPSQAYRTDSYSGVFAANRWYRYNLAGDNRISPTFDVYLLKRGSTVYKLQILNYYDAAGQPRRITFRYAQIS